MEKIKGIFLKNANKPTLYLILILGVIMLVFGNLFLGDPISDNTTSNEDVPVAVDYELQLEKRLEIILSKSFQDVSVMIAFSEGHEIVPATDIRTNQRRIEEGDRVEQADEKEEKNTILNQSGSNQGFAVKTLYPKARGAIISVKGGDDAKVQESITNAVRAVLNIAPHNIIVLPK